jgi:parvulin-like peptidyl-prolyl isomerase
VIVFAATMFTGVVVFGGLFDKKSSSKDLSKAVATVGDLTITQQDYSERLSMLMSQFRQANPYLSLGPDQLEYFQWNAFLGAMNFVILTDGAQKAKIKVTRTERNQILDSICQQYKLSGKSQLKALLASNNMEFDTFMDMQAAEYLVQKFSKKLQEGITVSDVDVDRKYTEVHVRHILIRVSSPTMNESAKSKADEAMKLLASGVPFGDVVKRFSDDLASRGNGGDLGWVSGGVAEPILDNVLFVLKNGQMSRPIKSSMGYEIMQVLDRRDKARPLDLDYAKEKEAILNAKRNQAVQSFVQTYVDQHPLKISDPLLSAYQGKLEGDVQKALSGYQAQISQSPSSPVPHYLLAKVYFASGNLDMALAELKRGEVKAELTPNTDFSALHLALAQAYKRHGDASLSQEQYVKAIKVADAQFDIVSLQSLKKIFQSENDSANLARVREAVLRFQAKVKESGGQVPSLGQEDENKPVEQGKKKTSAQKASGNKRSR